MAKKIILKNNINNSSIQIRDIAYYIDNINATASGLQSSSEIPVKIGVITSMGSNFIEIETPVCDTDKPSGDDFIMFQKDVKVNNTSLLGYYAEVKLVNNSTEKAELFALSSEVTASSK